MKNERFWIPKNLRSRCLGMKHVVFHFFVGRFISWCLEGDQASFPEAVFEPPPGQDPEWSGHLARQCCLGDSSCLRYLEIFGYVWGFLAIFGYFWGFLAVFDFVFPFWGFLTIFGLTSLGLSQGLAFVFSRKGLACLVRCDVDSHIFFVEDLEGTKCCWWQEFLLKVFWTGGACNDLIWLARGFCRCMFIYS